MVAVLVVSARAVRAGVGLERVKWWLRCQFVERGGKRNPIVTRLGDAETGDKLCRRPRA